MSDCTQTIFLLHSSLLFDIMLVSLPAIVTGGRPAWTGMSDLCPLSGGASREIQKPPARNTVPSELHLKVATAGEEH